MVLSKIIFYRLQDGCSYMGYAWAFRGYHVTALGHAIRSVALVGAVMGAVWKLHTSELPTSNMDSKRSIPTPAAKEVVQLHQYSMEATYLQTTHLNMASGEYSNSTGAPQAWLLRAWPAAPPASSDNRSWASRTLALDWPVSGCRG